MVMMSHESGLQPSQVSLDLIVNIHIKGVYKVDLECISSISQAYLRHMSGVSPVYIRYF